MDLDFFVIAPEIPDLIEVDDELDFITDKLTGYPNPPLSGIVTAADVEHEVERYHADVLFIASHNDNDGIVVSDGRINEDHISGYVQSLVASLVILSVCDGERIAKRVHRATGVAVLYCRIEVADREAMLYTARFVAALARCDSYHEAFSATGSARGRYVFLEGDGNLNNATQPGAISDLARELSALRAEVVGLRVDMANLKTQMDFVREQARIPLPAQIEPFWMYVFGALMLLMTTGIFVGLFR